ncbi:MAG: tRNA glutamyl-Q(34) synthetase GluQRS [Pseudomonadota bacterium]
MFVTRFAPSPTGYLHKGHAFSALTARAAAHEAGGRFLLRIEDIDATRCRPEYDAAIFEDLAWIGLDWETPVRRQSEHMADYDAALVKLNAMGVLYRCFRTRSELQNESVSAPHGPMEAFRGEPLPPEEEIRRLVAGESFAWRLSLSRAEALLGGFGGLTFLMEDQGRIQARPEIGGDVVLARKDVRTSYHLASVVDDALQGVTHVIRGTDLEDAPHVHRLLQALLGLPTPIYRHHRLLVGADGKRLAKRDKSETLRALREGGLEAAALRRELGFE